MHIFGINLILYTLKLSAGQGFQLYMSNYNSLIHACNAWKQICHRWKLTGNITNLPNFYEIGQEPSEKHRNGFIYYFTVERDETLLNDQS